MGAYDDLFGPDRRLVPLKILDLRRGVPEGNVLLRCLQYVDLEHRDLDIDYIRYCWSNQCGNCELTLATEGGPSRRVRACQTPVGENMEILELPRHVSMKTKP